MEFIPKQRTGFLINAKFLHYGVRGVFAVLLLSLILLQILQSQRENEIENLGDQLAEQATQEQREKREQISEFRKKTNDYAELLKAQVNVAPLFEFLERNVHTQVFMTNVDMESSLQTATVSGVAEDFKVLEEQLLRFRASPSVQSVVINVGTTDENGVAFTGTLTFIPDFLR